MATVTHATLVWFGVGYFPHWGDVAEGPQVASASGDTFSHPATQQNLFLVKILLEELPDTSVRKP